jgi:hypothetical protein
MISCQAKGRIMNSRHFFLKVAVAVAVAVSYWLLDSIVHYFGYGESEFELIPSDFNEMWMRSVILILLIAFGIFADYHTHRIIEKDLQKHDVYAAMLDATQHILNNFLQNMVYFRYLAEKSSDIGQETIELYDQTIIDTANQVNNLKNIQNPTRESIRERFLPV